MPQRAIRHISKHLRTLRSGGKAAVHFYKFSKNLTRR
jgi:hypothetical protein